MDELMNLDSEELTPKELREAAKGFQELYVNVRQELSLLQIKPEVPQGVRDNLEEILKRFPKPNR